MLMAFPILLYTKAQCTHTPVSEGKAEEVPVLSLLRSNHILLSEVKYMMTPPLVVCAPIVKKYSVAPTLFLCTYRHTEKLLPLMLSTSFVTMDLQLVPSVSQSPSFPSKLAAPVDRAPQLDGDNRDKGEPDERNRED